ncbi:Nucleoside-diphosphate-sugar epimerase [Paramyrothecium foliicola]|nr:Nucleoside-diphosphate-sugar epimerase [Paramyrothecium foliicola]
MSTTIKTVAVTGASGALGAPVLQKLLSSGLFKVRVLRRNGSKATFPADVEVVDVDFSSVESLKSALAGQDALVSTVGSDGFLGQTVLLDAAAAAGVKRVLPSEFGSDLDHAETRSLPVFGHKVQVQDHVTKLAETTGLTYTFVYNNAFLDWGLENKFLLDVSEFKPLIIDDGETVTSATTLDSVATAVVGVLTHPEETKNRAVRIEDTKITQNQLLAYAKAAAPEKNWEPKQANLDDVVAGAYARLAEGKFDHEVIVPLLWKSIFGKTLAGNFKNVDNELLGVKGKTEQEVAEIVGKYTSRIIRLISELPRDEPF